MNIGMQGALEDRRQRRQSRQRVGETSSSAIRCSLVALDKALNTIFRTTFICSYLLQHVYNYITYITYLQCLELANGDGRRGVAGIPGRVRGGGIRCLLAGARPDPYSFANSALATGQDAVGVGWIEHRYRHGAARRQSKGIPADSAGMPEGWSAWGRAGWGGAATEQYSKATLLCSLAVQRCFGAWDLGARLSFRRPPGP